MTREIAIISIATLVAGIINSIAGGGTLLSFPALLWIGRNPIAANATNSVALWPGSLAGAIGFRRELAGLPRWLLLLTIPAVIGGIIGALLLLHTPEKLFTRIVPWLILAATLLLAAQEVISRWFRSFASANERPARGWVIFAFTFQLLVAIYGGYFGAGQGILMLAALGLIGLTDMHQMNGLKNLLATCVNGVAAICFAISGAVLWRDAAIMAVAAILGGYLGARIARRLGRGFVRWAVVTIGLVMTVALFVKR
ncbi:MAG TPA: sulfite exporter TauE/SafE family protein [Thermoanaerobaculia bacterium]|jgi:uncharacterized membrane protein YfcA|nr:sulfite exporter TauE/SafE family protein [Thermoanaerobaculia bacterium]